MKYSIIFFACMILIQHNQYAAIGCMSASQVLGSGDFDYKQVHYVSCHCSCHGSIASNSFCNKCGHFRVD